MKIECLIRVVTAEFSTVYSCAIYTFNGIHCLTTGTPMGTLMIAATAINVVV